MAEKASTLRRVKQIIFRNATTVSLLIIFVSLLSYQAHAVIRPEDSKYEAQATPTADGDTPQSSPVPSTTPGNTSPGPSISPTPKSSEHALTSNTNLTGEKISYDWTPWLLGGGLILLIVVISSAVRLTKRKRK